MAKFSKWRNGLIIGLVLLATALGLSRFYPAGEVYLPTYGEVRKAYEVSDALLLDRHGEVIHEMRVDFEGRKLEWTCLKDVSPALIQALIASEDKRFYEHGGVDWPALARAVKEHLFSSGRSGASTIPMQLASILSDELRAGKGRRSIVQKWYQIKAARRLGHDWSRAQILEAYLNLVTFRGELQGVAAASWGLFRKAPGGLNKAESVVLASLIRSPNAPAEMVVKRACLLAARMDLQKRTGEIAALGRESLTRPYCLKPRACLAPHVAVQVLRPGDKKKACTIDGRLQRFASGLLIQCIITLKNRNVHDGAVLVVDNPTGEILAYVGNAGEASSARHVDGIHARRQAGSTLKPFLYGLVFERRILTPASLLDDSPVNVMTERGIYSPENYDRDFKGTVTARTALASSLNIPAVKTLSLIGIEAFLRRLKELGFKDLRDEDYYGLSLALGSADVTLFELVNGYRTLANGGCWSELALTFDKGKRPKRRVYSDAAAFLVSDIVSDREARSSTFGLENPLATRFWTAVKTGTSKDMRDNWCIGYTESYTVGVWVGNFKGAPMWDVSGVTGAAPIWFEIMNYLHHGRPGRPPKVPKGVAARSVCFADEGLIKKEVFIRGTETDRIRKQTIEPVTRILYPATGEIIALDPDIPAENQRIFCESSVKGGELRWTLDGEDMGTATTQICLSPVKGKHELALVDKDQAVIDKVTFVVR
ncbi:MAG: penicillin-binding protein 1C [Pseudomonadota bacterium]